MDPLVSNTTRSALPRPWTLHDGLSVYRFGCGEPVLFMPGPHRFQQPGDRTADALIAGLVALGREVVTFDPPGSGNSTRPSRLGMAEMRRCAGEALDACGVSGPVDVLGHSMGGLAAVAFALQESGRVRRLILVGTGSGGPAYMRAPGALWNRSHAGFTRLALLGMLHIAWPRLGPQLLMLNYIERQSLVDRRLVRPEPVTARDWLRPRRGRTDWHRIARRLDYSRRLWEIRVPALVLVGRYDPQFPPGASEQLAAGIHGAWLVCFERSGHYPFLEEPGAFWRAVRRFLDAAGEAAAAPGPGGAAVGGVAVAPEAAGADIAAIGDSGAAFQESVLPVTDPAVNR